MTILMAETTTTNLFSDFQPLPFLSLDTIIITTLSFHYSYYILLLWFSLCFCISYYFLIDIFTYLLLDTFLFLKNFNHYLLSHYQVLNHCLFSLLLSCCLECCVAYLVLIYIYYYYSFHPKFYIYIAFFSELWCVIIEQFIEKANWEQRCLPSEQLFRLLVACSYQKKIHIQKPKFWF